MKKRIALLLALLLLLCLCIPAQAASLKRGSRGDDVTKLQKKLRNWGYYSGAVDGIFGGGTEQAVMYFQRKNGLTPDEPTRSASSTQMRLSSAASSISVLV